MTAPADVTFEATDVQVRLFQAAQTPGTLYIGFGGGIRGTKTFGCLGLLLTLCRVFPGSRWAVVRKDLPTLRRNTLPSYNKLRAEHFPGFAGEVNQSDWTATCRNGSQILFFPESIETDPELDRWKGLEVNGFLLEEADELQERSFFKAIERAGAWIMAQGRTAPPPYVFCTFNPNAGWPKRAFYEPWANGTIAPPYAFIPATAADNPFVPEAVREAWKNMPEADYKRFVQGDWDTLSGRYYDTLDPKVHVIDREQLPETLPAWWTYWGGFDWGYSHWAPFGYFAEDGDGNEYLLDTLWQRRGQDDEYAQAIRAEAPHPDCLKMVHAGHDCWAKPTARGGSGVSTYDVFLRYGILLRRADIDRANGGRALRRAFAFKRDAETGRFVKGHEPKLFIVRTPGNLRLVSQLLEIMPDEDKPNEPKKVDADSRGRGGDDGADMLRYGIASKRRKPEAPIPELDDWNPITPDVLRANHERSLKLPPRRVTVPSDPDFGEF